MSVIWINVRLMGGEHLANVEVLFEDLQTTTALMLKEKVYEACSIPIAQQTLFNSAGARVSDAGPLFADSLGRFQSRYLQFVVGVDGYEKNDSSPSWPFLLICLQDMKQIVFEFGRRFLEDFLPTGSKVYGHRLRR